MFMQIVADAFKVVGCGGCPAKAHSALKHSLKPSVHLRLIDKFSPVGVLKAFANRSAHPSVLIG